MTLEAGADSAVMNTVTLVRTGSPSLPPSPAPPVPPRATLVAFTSPTPPLNLQEGGRLTRPAPAPRPLPPFQDDPEPSASQGSGVLGGFFGGGAGSSGGNSAEGPASPTGEAVEAAIANELGASVLQLPDDSIKMEAAAEAPLVVTVGEPMMHHDGGLFGGSHVTYLISTKTSLPEFAKQEFSVRRRFREVVSLASRLELAHRGYFVPPRPEKNIVESKLQSSEFIELRRLLLQRYMQKLARHPVLRTSKILKLFLEYEGALATNIEWSQMKTLEGSSPQTDIQGRWFKELNQKFKNKVGLEAPQAQVEDTDEKLQNERVKFKEMEAQLALSSVAAESLVQRMEKLATSLGDFGLTCIKLSKSEDEEGVRTGKYSEAGEPLRAMSVDFKRAGTTAVRMSRLTRSAMEGTAAHLTHVHDYLGLVPAARAGLRNRRQCMLSYQTIVNEMSAKRRKIGELENMNSRAMTADPNRTRKIVELKRDLEHLEVSKTKAYEMMEEVTKRNHAEVERFEEERKLEHLAMLKNVGDVMKLYYARSGSIWEDMATGVNKTVPGLEEAAEATA